jgi:hypothetical protein
MFLELRQEGEFQYIVKDRYGKAVAGFNDMDEVSQYMDGIAGKKWAQSPDPHDLLDQTWRPTMPALFNRRDQIHAPEPY